MSYLIYPLLLSLCSLIIGPILKKNGYFLGLFIAIFSGLLLLDVWSGWSLITLDLINLDSYFFLDGLSKYFLTVVFFIGALIGIYSFSYMKGGHSFTKFYTFLGVFQLGMVGLVTSNNWLTLVIFWELTSLSSFFLISHNKDSIKSQKGAMRALITTVVGGLFLLFSAFVFWSETGTLSLSGFEVFSSLSQSSSNLIFIGILMAVISKSAQFPFHFWLPGAMAAPTPVSAYLHSATLVKAGIFLLLRFFPFLSEHIYWSSLVPIGFFTYLMGGFWALKQDDLKGLLAYSTIAQLGLMVGCLGLGTVHIYGAVLVHLVTHAIFKACLFMNVGNIDHFAHTRSIEKLNGVGRKMPITAACTWIAGLSMAGVPLLNGFVSKENILHVLVEDFRLGYVYSAVVLVGAVFTFGYVLKMCICTFKVDHKKPITDAHESNFFGVFSPVLLSILCLILGIFPNIISKLYDLVLSSQFKDYHDHIHLHAFAGFNALFFASVIALGIGTLLFFNLKFFKPLFNLITIKGDVIFDSIFNTAISTGSLVSDRLLDKFNISRIISWLIFAVFIFVLFHFNIPEHFEMHSTRDFSINSINIANLILLVFLTIITVLSCMFLLSDRVMDRWVQVMLLGATGSNLILLFMVLGAPDLALTQACIEIASLALITVVLLMTPLSRDQLISKYKRYRSFNSNFNKGYQWLSFLGFLVAGFFLGYFVLVNESVSVASEFYRQNVLSVAGGKNLVNVILVDFRGFDTLGEIAVLGASALAFFACIRREEILSKIPVLGVYTRGESSWTRNCFAILLTLLAVYGLHLIFKGHHAAGGGFIGGLVAGVALVGFKFFWPQAYFKMKPKVSAHKIMYFGFALSIVSVIIPMFFGDSLFRSYLIGGVFSTSTFFDFGLALLVIAVVVYFVDFPAEDAPV